MQAPAGTRESLTAAAVEHEHHSRHEHEQKQERERGGFHFRHHPHHAPMTNPTATLIIEKMQIVMMTAPPSGPQSLSLRVPCLRYGPE